MMGMVEEPESPLPAQSACSDLEDRIGYHFKDPRLLIQALTHKSYAAEHGTQVQDNERLEFLGDAVLELVISRCLYDRHGRKCREGELTRMRSFLVNESQLASLARLLDLGRYLRLGRGEDKNRGREKPSILSDALEGLIGALYLDGGIDEAFRIIEALFGSLLDQAVEIGIGHDFKSLLQELTQKRFHAVPNYRVEAITGPDHQRTFVIALYFNGEVLARGKGKSKKEAEQKAARKALAVLQNRDN